MQIVIGHYVVTESREITRCPSYYAADTETLSLTPGRYPLRLEFRGGYTVPMPYWLLSRVASTRVSGRLYSGFGGNNFASTELPAGEVVQYGVQRYFYELGELEASGAVELSPRGRELVSRCQEAFDAKKWGDMPTWEELRASGLVAA